ncbi:23S rRNA (guanosine(2251)-2'-O)-methyltransferase RlmB [Porphyromonas sp. oral taxon 275]|uniref:23S rRNA (guanosine(2251)-2'-O)-methyltransferase RlmB n=1 Tax=Porphyromonas sp. oral taxon 275 TaxID=712435 RepID=UPI001BA729BA|nr:23S rRNA (guanosine(2251)-2'-O)-methyltransferase RlmB [Porphyromonas sp. oral taxon 275]QUB42394.1 23S rRNA (guanosine(2251)-2'-O)-methyltransferase RlmB [Porphyromonas sp. oral taxon 275]
MAKSNMIFGIHPLLEALEAGREIDKVMMRRGLRTEESARILALSRERSVPVQFVPEERLGRLTQRQHQGVIAFISEIEYTPLEELVARVYEEGRAPFIVLLDGLTDVRNFGAIARTAECAGVDALVIPERGSVSVTADAVKTSAGALHRIPVCRVSSIAAAVGLLQSSGVRVVAASEKAEERYTETALQLPLGLVMGAEDHGVSTDVLRMADSITRIPQVGAIGSLNVSVAAGILIYEAVRQEQLGA